MGSDVWLLATLPSSALLHTFSAGVGVQPLPLHNDTALHRMANPAEILTPEPSPSDFLREPQKFFFN